LIGKGHTIGGDGDQNHLNEINDAPAKPVGKQAKGQSHQGTGEDRCGHQQAKFGFVKADLGLDLDPDDGKHGPHREVDGEGQGVHSKDGILFPWFEFGNRAHFFPLVPERLSLAAQSWNGRTPGEEWSGGV
jgi:hypothetical protein